MHYSTIILNVLFAALASARGIQLFALSKEDPNHIPFRGLYFRHSGAALDYTFIGFNATEIEWDADAGKLYETRVLSGGYTTNYTIQYSDSPDFFPYVKLTPGEGAVWSLGEGNKLQLAGSDGSFYAAKSTKDPYNWSDAEYVVGYTTAGIDSLKELGQDVTEIDIIASFPDQF